MDFSSLPPYRGVADDSLPHDRDCPDRSAVTSLGLVLAAVVVLLVGTAAVCLLVVRLVAAPAG